VTWSERANPKAIDLNGVTWIPWLSLWVAVGNGDTDAYIVTSPDGTTWTERAPTVALSLILKSVSYSTTLVVAVGSSDGTNPYILTSPDAITWTKRTPAVARPISLERVIWFSSPASGGVARFVAVGDAIGAAGYAYILYSLDGITWVEVANPKLNNLLALAAGDSILLASGGSGSVTYTITSRDGINWTERENLTAAFAEGAAWNGKRFVMVGLVVGGASALVETSLSKP